jgi:helix-turn-helix protein
MLSDDLKAIIGELGISQADFARLIGVTPRAVTLWMVGDRSIPGPVEAYARLVSSVPLSVRQIEFARLKQRRTRMRDGMYGVEYSSVAGGGLGVLIMDSGRVFGADPMGGKYDGDYIYDEDTGIAELNIKVTFPPNVHSVFGISHPYEWSINLTTKLNPHLESGKVRIATPFEGRHLDARYRYLRSLPEA